MRCNVRGAEATHKRLPIFGPNRDLEGNECENKA